MRIFLLEAQSDPATTYLAIDGHPLSPYNLEKGVAPSIGGNSPSVVMSALRRGETRMQCAKLACACLGLVLLACAPIFAGPTFTVFSDPSGGQGSTFQFGLNNAGDYVGSYMDSGGVYYGFMHSTSGFSPVASSDPTGYHPTGINNSNSVVGYYQDPTGTHGFVENGGAYSTLNVAGASSTYAYGTNDKGQVVGYYVEGGVTHGFSEIGGVTTTVDVPGALATYIWGVNNSGEMVGSYYDASGSHAFVYSGGHYTTIDYPGAPYSYARGINNHGDVVGWYAMCVDCPQVGFLLDPSGHYTSIDPLYNVPTFLTGINDRDQIMISIMAGTLQSPFNLDIRGLIGGPPVGPEPASPTPEPATSVLMAAGAMAMFAVRRFRRRA